MGHRDLALRDLFEGMVIEMTGIVGPRLNHVEDPVDVVLADGLFQDGDKLVPFNAGRRLSNRALVVFPVEIEPFRG